MAGASLSLISHALRPGPQLIAPRLPGSQVIFYILGSLTVVWGFVLYFFLADGPSNAKWLKKEHRPLAVARVAANGTGIKSKNFDKGQAIEALCDLKAWLIAVRSLPSPHRFNRQQRAD